MLVRSYAARLKGFFACAFVVLATAATHHDARATPTYVCIGLCTEVIVTDPTLPPPQLGSLVNILGISIDGVLYDVAFVDGKFIDIFGATPTLPFTTGTQAQRAAQALNDTLIDAGGQNFDSVPSLTRGCTRDQFCLIMTPFSLATEVGPGIFRSVEFINDNPFLDQFEGDYVGDSFGSLSSIYDDFALSNDDTFAVWRRSGTSGATDVYFTAPTYASAYVPEPGTLALLGLGVAGLALTRRRRR